MLQRKVSGVVDLPKGVHRLTVRGRLYLYWHPGRGTKQAQKPRRLPDDPTSPEFWVVLREMQGTVAPGEGSLGNVIDLYMTSPQFLSLTSGTQGQYERSLRIAREAWGKLPAAGLRPVHVRAMMDQMADTPGKANCFLGSLRALSSWGRVRDLFQTPICDGVKPFAMDGGHKPWTESQIVFAKENFVGALRKAFFIALYTGQRGSDIIRLSPADVDEAGFRLQQRKTGREIWCPIVPELAEEMATWEAREGPYVRGEKGKPLARNTLDILLKDQRGKHAELEGVTMHGLRSTAVIRLRRLGLSSPQIQDIVGMSLAMIERYSRFSDKKASGKAALKIINRPVDKPEIANTL